MDFGSIEAINADGDDYRITFQSHHLRLGLNHRF